MDFFEAIDAPFSVLHEMYRISYLRAEARARDEEERKKKEEEEARKKKSPRSPPQRPRLPTDAKQQAPMQQSPTIDPVAAGELEDAMEDFLEGGM